MRRPPWTGRAELIGVPFDGMGRAGGMAGAPHALRAAGFAAAFGAGARLGEDVDVPDPKLRASVGEAGLVFLDGHEDATPMELSDDGEAANMGDRDAARHRRS